ncbi:alanine-tRNA ligase, cytoplasmic-like protein 2, partial [Sarcoptes scabiei]
TLTIALSDGGRPDNVGRGYVLRRILRRAVRFIEKLGGKPGDFGSLVPVVVESLGDFFPELNKNPNLVIEIINEEESQFLKTLSRGKRLIEKAIEKLQDGSKILPGEIAWKLYDTYGFPIDLTRLMAEEHGLAVDMEKFEQSKAASQALSQAKLSQLDGSVELDVHSLNELKDELKIPLTNDQPKYNYNPISDDKDSVYHFENCSGKVLAIRKSNSFVKESIGSDLIGLIMDQTNFYAEAGGQEYDTGYFLREFDGNEIEFKVVQVKCYAGYIVHIGFLTNESMQIKIDDVFRMEIDTERRKLIMNNHTGTHVLNFALRTVLNEIDQKGSLVAPDRLRFDFTNKAAMTMAELKQVESIARDMIIRNQPVYAKESSLSQAKLVKGLRAVFDETYPDPVRIVSIGVPVEQLLQDPSSTAGMTTSVEFCGGTHLKRTGHIGDFVLTSEESISKGIRRIVCLTGPEATRSMNRLLQLDNEFSELRVIFEANQNRTNLEHKAMIKRILDLQQKISSSEISCWKKDEIRSSLNGLKKQLDNYEKTLKASQAVEVINEAKKFATENRDARFLIAALNAGSNAKALDSALKAVKTINAQMAALFFSVDEENNKILCLSSVPKEIVDKGLLANEWINNIVETINGKGGGRPESAQATGTKIDSLQKAIEMSKEFAKLKLS